MVRGVVTKTLSSRQSIVGEESGVKHKLVVRCSLFVEHWQGPFRAQKSIFGTVSGQNERIVLNYIDPRESEAQRGRLLEPEVPESVRAFRAAYPDETFSDKPKAWREKHKATVNEREKYKQARSDYQAYKHLKLANGFLEEARQDMTLQRWRSVMDNVQLAIENATKSALAVIGPVGRTHQPAPLVSYRKEPEQVTVRH